MQCIPLFMMSMHVLKCALPVVGVPLQDQGSEIEQLEHKLSDYRDIIGRQEELLQVSLSTVEMIGLKEVGGRIYCMCALCVNPLPTSDYP